MQPRDSAVQVELAGTGTSRFARFPAAAETTSAPSIGPTASGSDGRAVPSGRPVSRPGTHAATKFPVRQGLPNMLRTAAMAANETLRRAGRIAVWGAESGIIVTLAGVVPVLFLGTYVMEDLAATAMLIAYGLLFGHYLASRLVGEGIAITGQAWLLRAAPPAAMVAGFIGMRLLMGLSGAVALSAGHGLVFGGLAGLILGLAVQRIPAAMPADAPLPRALTLPAICLAAGAVMGLVAGFALTIPLGWTVAIPIWQMGMGGVIGLLLDTSPQPA